MTPLPTLVHAMLETESGPIPVRDFAHFLYHFRAAYVAALDAGKQLGFAEEPTGTVLRQLAEQVAQELSRAGPPGISRLALANLPAVEELNLVDIFRINPIDIVFSCIGVALSAAVIVAGGEVKWDEDGFHVKIPPLHTGIAKLELAINGEGQLHKRLVSEA